MPHVADPETGFVASANNQPDTDGCGAFLGVDWIEGYRQARIVELLAARRDWDVRTMLALQVDQYSLPWRELREIVLTAPAVTTEARDAQTMLGEWDGVVGADSVPAAIFELFLTEMIQRMVQAKARRARDWGLGKGVSVLGPHAILSLRRVGHFVRHARSQPQGWFARPWGEEIADALTTVIRRLRARHGTDPHQWRWGRVRPLTLRHPFGQRTPFQHVFNLGPLPWGGDANTVAQASVDLLEPTANPIAIASLRMVIDCGDWEACRYALPGGQSGNPASPHYDDLLPAWSRGDGVPIAWSPAAIDRAVRVSLQLVPEGN
jgi:penicillin amidase